MAFIDKGLSNEYRRSTRPQPLVPGKHALNPPIVTVIGAGVAGLTAAHELVERGFLVQVVESTPDPYYPERPLVGGMAANQRARVRANVEDLHRALIDLREKPEKRVLVEWMLWLFSLNRSRWIQTEAPEPVCRFVHWGPKAGPLEPKGKYPDVIKELVAAKDRYRKRWIWDLTVRGALLGSITKQGKASALSTMTALYERWCESGPNPAGMIEGIHRYLQLGDVNEEDRRWGIPVPEALSEEDITNTVGPAFEREFLCFRLVPRAVQGVEGADGLARELYAAWMTALLDDKSPLKHCVLRDLTPGKDGVMPTPEAEAAGVQVVQQPERLHERQTGTSQTAWLQIEIIEQRLPGEHGYRFFPSFYRHLDDTMKRIPITDESGRVTGRTVYDNLRPTVFQGLGMSREDLEVLGLSEPGSRGPLDDVTADRTPTCDHEQRDPEADADGDDDLFRRKAPVPAARVVEIHRDRAKTIEGFRNRTDRFVQRLGGSKRDGLLFFSKMFRYMTASPERRRKEYEGKTWSTFVDMEIFSPAMKKHIAAAAQVLLAFSVGEADARTYGNIATQLFLDQMEDGTRTDRTLNGPTSTAWLEPWRDYLERQGVLFFRKELTDFAIVTNEKNERELVPLFKNLGPDSEDFLTYDKAGRGDDARLERRPDFYVLAVSLPKAAEVLGVAARAFDEATVALGPPRPEFPLELARVIELHEIAKGAKAPYEGEPATRSLKEMTGLQFFFDAKTSIGRGHMYFPLSAWGLSSISQSEFWLTRGGFSDGYLGVLSVDVCTTDKRGTEKNALTFKEALGIGKIAKLEEDAVARGRFAAARQVWWDIAKRIDEKDKLAEPRCFHVDSTISADGNASLFLASTPGLRDRPGRRGGDTCVGDKEIKYDLHFNRWVVCGTYMATHTRMTTMEAANESARHAVKAILDHLGKPIARHHEKLVIDDLIPKVREGGPQPDPAEQEFERVMLDVDALGGQHHNGAWEERPFDPPDVWNPENYEMEDLDLFRRIDRRLLELDLPHFLDIVEFDRRLKVALDQAELDGRDTEIKVANLIGLASAGLDAAATKERGRGYAEKDKQSVDRLKAALKTLADNADGRFPDLKATLSGDGLLDDLIKELIRRAPAP